MARKAHLETILCSHNRLSGLYQALMMETNLCIETNWKRTVLYGMASASIRRSKLAKAAVVQNKVENIAKTAM